jgi:hypothetical protein
MNDRRGARRRKGSHPQTRYSRGINGAEILAEIREADAAAKAERESTVADKAIEYWRNVEVRPLFVYFVVESPTYFDYVGIYSEDERDEFYDGFPTGALRAVKIGKALDPRQRVRELACGNPRGLHLEQVILANQHTERRLHQHWGGELRFGAGIRGEWYGNRYFDAILAVAAATCQAQIEAHKAGENMHYITELLPMDVATNKLGKEAA